MITKLLTRDISLILAASFFYMACPMMVTPLIAGFSESLGASARWRDDERCFALLPSLRWQSRR